MSTEESYVIHFKVGRIRRVMTGRTSSSPSWDPPSAVDEVRCKSPPGGEKIPCQRQADGFPTLGFKIMHSPQLAQIGREGVGATGRNEDQLDSPGLCSCLVDYRPVGRESVMV
jgi:hypothetical protein